MALLDAAATAEEYRAATSRVSTVRDAELEEALKSNTRRLEKMLDVAVGYWNTHSATYTFDGRGGSILYLRQDGRGYCLTAITADSLKVDDDDDGTFEYTWDLDEDFVRGLPVNASSTTGEPFKALQLLTGRSAPRTTWPIYPAAVEIAGTWGWAEVPHPVRAAVIAMTREELDAQAAGSTRQLFGPDGETFDLLPDPVKQAIGRAAMYGARLPKAMAV